MIPFLRPCRAAAPRMTRGRSPVPGPCGRRAAAGSRSRGRPARGVAHPPCGDGFPLPRASRTRSRWPCICTVASRSRGRPARGVAHPPCGDGLPLPRASPAASPVRPCAGALLRPPHFHHSIWKANDKPAPPNVMISLRFPAAGAEKKRASPPARTFLLFTSPHVHAVPCIAIASRLAFTIL